MVISLSCAFAGPKIEADRTTVDCGTVFEGKTDQLHAQFTIRNTGDAPLAIENVRPGCGCTVVKFDTLVLPGKSSVILATVNLAGFHPGPLSKYITVKSNAANNGSLQLTITAAIKPIIEVTDLYITLQQQKPHTIVFACAKKDLRVTAVGLTSGTSSPTATLWQSNLPLPIPFKWTADTTRPDGYRVFRLELAAPAVSERMAGQFVIKTDHPDKPEISISGSIEK
ncbi:MAG TPA: DUF1573 domain-containing protein [Chitinivibrionales bacterium]|jgi:hypothetical protein|nr:DUF1573 domain-containing protein [Chitinivibrionales bacterium]